MTYKHITLCFFLMLLFIARTQAQEVLIQDTQSVSSDKLENLRWFTGSIQIPERFAARQIKLNQNVYWLMGVNNSGFQIGTSTTMVYSYIDKPQLGELSKENLLAPDNNVVDVTQVKTSHHQRSYQDKLAPSIQFTF